MMKYVESGSGYSHSVGYTYDEINNLTALAETVNGVIRNTSYTYDDDNRVTTVENKSYDANGNEQKVTTVYTYDAYGRISQTVTKNGNTTILTESYTYHTSTSGKDANWVYRLRSRSPGRDVTYTYSYDNNGNIVSVNDGTNKTTYTYDSANQLTRENNQGLGKTWVWTYDDAGNIKSRKEYAYTTGTLGTVLSTMSYDYGDSSWGDLLTAYGGTTFSYDTIGNLTSDGYYTYTWEHGRQLANMTSSTADIDFTYDSNGMRVGKTVTTVTETTEPEQPEPEEPEVTYTVTFVADGVTVDTITVNSGYTLTAADYPTVPAKAGYTGAWNQYTSPVTSNITIQAVYTEVSGGGEETETHTVTFRVSYGSSYGYTMKTMEVEDGYVLTASDYPSGSYITWEQYTSPIHSDITVNGSYSWGGMSADGDAELVGSGENGAETAAVAAAATTTTTVTDYDYTYNGGQLTGEVITTTVDGTVTNTETLYYYYDASGKPVSVKYNGTAYFYVTNLQGDVLAIMNSSGTIVVEYTYDAWGYIRNTTGSMAATLGKANALRYRGYVYDTETALYYLQSRYYNPGTGRFILSDTLFATGQGQLGNNMYAYCLNNPIGMIDSSGTDAIYVTRTEGGNSLPIVGHAILYFQGPDGKWYKTEYTGRNKKDAMVSCDEADMEMINKMLNGEVIKGVQYSHISGDFSAGKKVAEKYDQTDYGGYSLLTNNCLHYVKEVLSAGTFDDPLMGMYILSSTNIVPVAFHTVIAQGVQYALVWGCLLNKEGVHYAMPTEYE